MSNIIKVLKTTLKGTLSTTGLTMTVQKFVDSKGNEVVDADFGGNFVVVLEQGTNIEMILCTGITQNSSDDTAILTIDSAGRHLNPKSPWTGGATGLQFTTGASVIVTNDPYTMSRLASLDKANTFSLKQTFTTIPESSDVPVSNNDLVNKTYADALVLGALTTINVIVPATAGETVSAGDLVYYDLTDKEWKLCDADTASTVENVLLAIAQGAGTNGNAITGGVLLRGVDSNQSGLTAGDVMYASNTAGEISSSVGTTEVTVGIAKGTTTLYFNPRFNQMLTEDQQDALAGTVGTPSATNKYVTADERTATPTADRIPLADGSGKIASGWIASALKSSNTTDFTAGEAIDASTTPQAVYLKASDGKVYLADTDADESTFKFLGFVGSGQNVATDATVTVNTDGVIGGFTGLTIGDRQYLSATAGAIGTTPVTNQFKEVGFALSTTQVYIINDTAKFASGSSSFSGSTSSLTNTVTIGFKVKILIAICNITGSSDTWYSVGVYTPALGNIGLNIRASSQNIQSSLVYDTSSADNNPDIKIQNITTTQFDLYLTSRSGTFTHGGGTVRYIAIG